MATLATQTFPLSQGGFVGHESAGEITRLLQGWRDGDRTALDALLPIVYKKSHRLAHFQLRQEHPDHRLQRAALVNEAYVRLGRTANSAVGEPHSLRREMSRGNFDGC